MASVKSDDKAGAVQAVGQPAVQPAEMITLVSNEGKEVTIKKDYAFISPMIKSMVEGEGATEGDQNKKLAFKNIPTKELEFVCEFLEAKGYAKETDTCFDSYAIKDKFTALDSIALSILVVANFLEI